MNSNEGGPVYVALYGDPECTDEISRPWGRGQMGSMRPRVGSDGKIELTNIGSIEITVPEDDGRTIRGMAAVGFDGTILHPCELNGVEQGPLVFPTVTLLPGKFVMRMLGPAK